MNRMVITGIVLLFVCGILWSGTADLEKLLYKLAGELVKAYAPQQSDIFKLNISIGPIENKNPKAAELQMGQVVRDTLLSIFSRSNFFNVIERDKLELLLQEQELQMSEVTDTAGAVQIGNILNAQAILYGNVIELSGSFTVTCTLVAVETGQTFTAQASNRLDLMYVQPMGIGISLGGVGLTYTGNNPTFVPFPDENNTIFRRNISAEVRYRITRFLMAGIGLDYVYGQLEHFAVLGWDMGTLNYPSPTGSAPLNVVGEGIGIPLNLTVMYSPLRWFNFFLTGGVEYFILDCNGYFAPSNGMGFGENDFGPAVHTEFLSWNIRVGAEVFVTPRLAVSLAAGYERAVFDLDMSPMWHLPDLPKTLEIDMSGFRLGLSMAVYF